jgi:hypothetical protein
MGGVIGAALARVQWGRGTGLDMCGIPAPDGADSPPKGPTMLKPLLPLLLLATPALAQMDLSSQVPGLAIAPLDDVPNSPMNQGDREACAHKLVGAPTTPAGEVAHFQGWGVTAEVPIGDLTAVSFVGRFGQGTSGSCELLDGNVGLFRGDRLLAVIYSEDPERLLIGSARAFGSGLRLWSGDFQPVPLADVVLTPAGAAVVPLAASEQVCNGAASVPLIYGLPIDRARQALAAAGWQPITGQTNPLSYAAEIAAAGVPEVEDCSGTGFGYCAYRYTGPAGELSVTTMGEIAENGALPAVVGYGVDCR